MKDEAVQTYADLQQQNDRLITKIESLEKRLRTAERMLFDYFFAAAITGCSVDKEATTTQVVGRASRIAYDAMIERQRWL